MAGEGLDAALVTARARYPQAAQVVEDLAPTLLRGQLERLLATRGEDFWAEAERLVGYAQSLGGTPADSLLEYTVAYLKEQVRFVATGEYSNSDFETARAQVYDNADVMERFYLEGLLLTHAFWPIHFDIHRFFIEEFVSRVGDLGQGVEVGFGHGLYLLDVLSQRSRTQARGYDISNFSLDYAGRLLRHAGIGEERFQLGLTDVREGVPGEDACYDWAIFAEILEHIPDPQAALHELHRVLKPGCPLFATTVMNSNALDHLYLYREVGEVVAQLEEAGFEVVAQRLLRVADYGLDSRDPSEDVALVCIHRGAAGSQVAPAGDSGD
jgi:ubiquinone/menaquinone biosynthesis C-methylase UbiE